TIGGARVTVAFTPGESDTVIREAVGILGAARRRVTVASMVTSSGPVLSALCEAADRGVPMAGLYDGPQMDTVLRQWRAAHVGPEKTQAWAHVAGLFKRKESIPYAPGTPHDFMHLKVIVADDSVLTGSFNFSNHARGNAENALLIRDAATADLYDGFIKGLVARYGK
ncbi:MAG: hypothetical protein KGQ28_01970, partial [Hyphomicrobiales bacterium]|nr:hypothetical protein [Hyphomicrobiales bacterium]